MNSKRRIHDAIVGVVVTAGVALGHYVDTMWLLVPLAIGVVLIQSGVTGFCPVYFILDKTCASDQAGSCAR